MFTMIPFTSRTGAPFGPATSRSLPRASAAAGTKAAAAPAAPPREILLFTSGTTLVTTLRVVVGGRAYSPDEIAGVAAGRTPRNLDGPFAALFAGAIAAGLGSLALVRLAGSEGHAWLAMPVALAVVLAGAAASAWGVVRWSRSKPQHTVLLDTTHGGRQVVLTHPSAKFVGRVVAAIHAATGLAVSDDRGVAAKP